MLLKVLFLAEFVAIAVASTCEASAEENADKQRESRHAPRMNIEQSWWDWLDKVPEKSALRTADDPPVARGFMEQEEAPNAASLRAANYQPMSQAFARQDGLPVGQPDPAAATGLRSDGDAPGAAGPGGPDGLASNVAPGLPNDPIVTPGPSATATGVSNSQRFTNDRSVLRAADQTGRMIELPETLRPRAFNNVPRPRTWPARPLGLRGNLDSLNGNERSRINAGLFPPQVRMSGPSAQRYNIEPSLARPSPAPARLVDSRLTYNPEEFFGFVRSPGGLPALHNKYKSPKSSAQIGPNGPFETRPFDPAWKPNQRFIDLNPVIRQDSNNLLHSSPHLPYKQPHHMGSLGFSHGLFGSRHPISDKIRFLLREWIKSNMEIY